jgi:hypothetical protein
LVFVVLAVFAFVAGERVDGVVILGELLTPVGHMGLVIV